MADNDAPVARLATLSTLPLEIKARICELAALQDERYQERWIPGAPGEKLVKVHLNEWRGRSLAALSETSKEFNELAAKHIFYTLTDTQIDSLTFSLVVLPRHASRVLRVVIAGAPPGGAAATEASTQRVFAALLMLPNLEDLRVSYEPTSTALGEFGTSLESPSGATGQIRRAFRPVARRLRTVGLVDFPSVDAIVSFLDMCENVQNLEIAGPAIVEDEMLLTQCLGMNPVLDRLTLDATSSGTAGLHLGNTWSLPLTWTAKTLSGLGFINIQLDASSVSLVNQHAATLRHLTLRLPEESPPNPQPKFPPFIPLPLLSSFTLQNASSEAFEAVVAAIATATSGVTSRSSRLNTLIVELKDRGNPLSFDRFEDALIPFEGRIRHLCVTGSKGEWLSRTIVRAMTPFREKEVLSSKSSRRDTFISRNPIASVTPDKVAFNLKVRHRAIHEALTYGANLADKLLVEESLEGMEIIVEVLGDIWGHKLLRDD